jgi:hypothetical protein
LAEDSSATYESSEVERIEYARAIEEAEVADQVACTSQLLAEASVDNGWVLQAL